MFQQFSKRFQFFATFFKRFSKIVNTFSLFFQTFSRFSFKTAVQGAPTLKWRVRELVLAHRGIPVELAARPRRLRGREARGRGRAHVLAELQTAVQGAQHALYVDCTKTTQFVYNKSRAAPPRGGVWGQGWLAKSKSPKSKQSTVARTDGESTRVTISNKTHKFFKTQSKDV